MSRRGCTSLCSASQHAHYGLDARRVRNLVLMATTSDDARALGDEAFVSLTTFRRSGAPVSTPVWIARDGDNLVVITPAESGKVKRIKNSDRVELRPCSRRGAVPDDAVAVTGSATIVTGDAASRPSSVLKKKYGIEYRIVMLVELIIARRRKPRVILSITTD
ncbi:PPOX class F420-dependent oxidoreductase [Rhodococcus fascians]|nr:PPOX class F420-dependent oxidoreductase [Rhodococcus fascians]MBY4140180.1 PPOX class F420-dependent oxidoreductase [Rhodococcus fascians]MBY4218845.1 PPOX class F420-dependent oxidoreductase [Rhodococcus fascians]MBY4223891.1 PPOX class F420-dependent oxidoreductase [Rhodococcus fascians]MBY4234206.1 PPOX class F420-dependent oxidoreductase [Rhodococcus fascians]